MLFINRLKGIKMTKLQNIKRIVNTFGSFTIADLEGDSSPLINSMGKDNIQLAERFYNKGVDAITYVHETEVSDDFIEYENLDKDVIDEINTLAENYEVKRNRGCKYIPKKGCLVSKWCRVGRNFSRYKTIEHNNNNLKQILCKQLQNTYH